MYCDDKRFSQSIRLKIRDVNPAGSKSIVDNPVSKVLLFLESKEGSWWQGIWISAKGAIN